MPPYPLMTSLPVFGQKVRCIVNKLGAYLGIGRRGFEL